jgi:hypothetical protein
MAKEIRTEIEIKASPEKIWKILTDFEHYDQWNPFIKSVHGEIASGKKIIVRREPPGMKGMTIKPTVLTYKANQELRWLGNLIIPGLFDGEHVFELIDNGNGTTTFRQYEYFKGMLVFLFKRMLDNNTTNGFRLMNQRLSEQATSRPN